MIAFKDFVPKQTTPPRLLSKAEYESLVATVQRANAWIAQSRVSLINVETVLLPNIHFAREEGSTDPELATGEGIHWHQVVRIWYND